VEAVRSMAEALTGFLYNNGEVDSGGKLKRYNDKTLKKVPGWAGHQEGMLSADVVSGFVHRLPGVAESRVVSP
jgi:hypothetical protein